MNGVLLSLACVGALLLLVCPQAALLVALAVAALAVAFAFAPFWTRTQHWLDRLFGRDPHAPREMLRLVPPHAVVTALVAPIVFRIAERAHAATLGAVPTTVGPER